MTGLPLDVLDALAGQLAAALPTVLVLDGEPRDEPSDRAVLVVGFSPEADSAVITQVPASLAGDDALTIDVPCLASCFSGDEDFGQLRARMRQLMNDVRAAIEQDDQLGGLVDDAEIAPDLGVRQARNEMGAEVLVAFAIRCQSF